MALLRPPSCTTAIPRSERDASASRQRAEPPAEHRALRFLPRQGRRGENPTRDEPFAWHSREFLRKKCIGQVRILPESRGEPGS